MMSRHHYFKPHTVRVIRPKWGKCLLCGQAKERMVWVKDMGVVCPDHDAYAVVYEYDNGYHTSQTVVKVFAIKEEAEKECENMNKKMVEARVFTGFRPASYTVRPLKELVYLYERITELEE
jgi:radical SAM superfamily enzyme